MAIGREVKPEYEAALADPDPVRALGALVRADVERSGDRATILDSLRELALALRDDGRERDEDAVLDVMDKVAGFCSPHERI